LLQIPAGLAMAVAFPIVGRLSDLGGARLYMIAGLCLLVYASYLMVGVGIDTPFWVFAWWLILSRVGLALVFPPLSAASLQVLPPELVGQGSGAINFLRTLGGAFGVNYLAISTDYGSVLYRQRLAASQTEGNATTMEYLETVRRLLGNAGLPEAIPEPSALYHLGQSVAHQALLLAYRDAFQTIAIVGCVAIILVGFVRPKA
jgi:MFS family permease